MHLRVINNIQDVVERQLCCGCGVCAYLSPDRIEMTDSDEHGRRPRHKGDRPDDGDAMKACPGIKLGHTADGHPADAIPELLPAWGPVLGVT